MSCRRPADIQYHIKKGGYHNTEVFYDDYLVNMITAELAKHNTNQNTGVIQKQMSTEAKEQGILLNAVANSGDLKAAQALCNLIMEIFKHRINFKIVAAEAGLVKETDYAERIYGEDCFPTTMVSESGIDKIYDCFDR